MIIVIIICERWWGCKMLQLWRDNLLTPAGKRRRWRWRWRWRWWWLQSCIWIGVGVGAAVGFVWMVQNWQIEWIKEQQVVAPLDIALCGVGKEAEESASTGQPRIVKHFEWKRREWNADWNCNNYSSSHNSNNNSDNNNSNNYGVLHLCCDCSRGAKT